MGKSSGRQSNTAPQLRLTTVPVMAPARSEAMKTAVSATCASVGRRCVKVAAAPAAVVRKQRQ